MKTGATAGSSIALPLDVSGAPAKFEVAADTSVARRTARYVTWPVLAVAAVWAQWAVMQHGVSPAVVFTCAFVALGAVVAMVELWIPFQDSWQRKLDKSDGQVGSDIVHNVFEQVGTAIGSSLAISLLPALTPSGNLMLRYVWPTSVPFVVQVVIALLVVEFALYWSHRVKHSHWFLWRIHAIHHSSPRVSAINAGRVHVLEAIMDAVIATAAVLAVGIPFDIVVWAWMTINGVCALSHANIDVRSGPLSYVFNTPDVHWQHHSIRRSAASKNFGDTLLVWDMVFGTYVRPEPGKEITAGIEDQMPAGAVAQMVAPFLWRRRLSLGRPIARVGSSIG